MTLLKAKAKVNLFFHIVGKREDGYHLIESLSVFTQDIYDQIEVSAAKTNILDIEPSEFSCYLQGKNLMETALELFSPNKYYQLKLVKNLPVGAGLGGGSSDAATLIKYLLNDSSMSENLIDRLKYIGADLPLCYTQTPQFIASIGEELTEVKNLPKFYMLLVNPRKSLLTKDVFSQYSCNFSNSIEFFPQDFKHNFDNFIDFLQNKGNDLTKAAIQLFPDIANILELLYLQKGCKFSRMSGSGATCFGVFRDFEAAKLAKDNISNLKPDYWIKISS